MEEMAENKFEALFFNQIETNTTELSAPHKVWGHGPMVQSVRVGPTPEEVAAFRNRVHKRHQRDNKIDDFSLHASLNDNQFNLTETNAILDAKKTSVTRKSDRLIMILGLFFTNSSTLFSLMLTNKYHTERAKLHHLH